MARKSMAKIRKAKNRPTWVATGFDVSMSSIAGAAFMYDGLLDRLRGPVFIEKRWNQGEHYFERCRDAARGHELLLDLIGQMKGAVPDFQQVYIAVEEPWPFGIVKRAQSAWIKQQAQIQGIFLGSLLRFGYDNLFEINTKTWQASVAADMDMKVNKDFDKWAVKKWALTAYKDVPDLPDLIKGAKGKVPKPAKSKAKAVQPNDIYDALGICDWMRGQIELGEVEVS